MKTDSSAHCLYNNTRDALFALLPRYTQVLRGGQDRVKDCDLEMQGLLNTADDEIYRRS